MDCNFTSVEQEVKTGDGSFLMWRGLHANGRRLPDGCTDKPLCIGQKTMMPLPVKDLPVQSLPYSPQEWVSVEEFGATGNGRTDDTLAVQKAMKSGAKVVCFTRSNYVINGCVCIPETVCEVIGFFAAIQRTVAADETAKASGIFVVSENSSQPLLVHQFITGGGIFLDHQEPRQVALEDVMVIFNHCRQDAAEDDMLFPSAVPLDTSLWRLYRNSRPDGVRKELFVTDCIGFAGDDGSSDCAIENVTVWGRLIDTEHVRHA